MRLPRASVVLAAYNAGRHLQRALDSILMQTVNELEVVVVNDGSNDRTRDIIDMMAGQDSRVRPLHLDSNIGLSGALNRGLNLCQSDVVIRMDADDIALPQRVELQIEFLQRNPTFGIVGSQAVVIDENGRTVGWRRGPLSAELVLWRSMLDNPFIHPSVAVRRSLIDRVGGYQEALRSGQDYELWHRMLLVTAGANLREPLILYRRGHRGTTNERRREQVEHHRLVSDARVAAVIGGRWLGEELDLLRHLFASPEFVGAHEADMAAALRGVRLFTRLGDAFCDATDASRGTRRVVRQDVARRVAGMLRSRGAFSVRPVAHLLGDYPTFLWDLVAGIPAHRKPRRIQRSFESMC